MTYEELKKHCDQMHVSVLKVAEEVGISFDGLKKGVSNGSLALRHILPLCESLCITPDQFFGLKGDGGVRQVQNGGYHNTQAVDTTGVAALEKQLEAKDKQIEQLLEIIKTR